MLVYAIYFFPILQTCAQQISSQDTLQWYTVLSSNSLQIFFATQDLTGNSKMIYRILRAVSHTPHHGEIPLQLTQRSSLRLLETDVVPSLSRAVNPLTSWKEPLDRRSVTLLISPEKSLDRGQHCEETLHSTASSHVIYPCSGDFRRARWDGNHLKTPHSLNITGCKDL